MKYPLYRDTLCPKLWNINEDGAKLDNIVRKGLYQIAKDFVNNLKTENNIDIKMQSADEADKIEKVLLMGRQGAGKTSMRSIIFANYLARDAYRITFTNDVNKSKVRFLGNLVLSLWDCGGQDLFMEQYFQSQRENIFKNVQVLIYVFDVTSKDFNGELQYYENCLNALTDLSPKAKIFCLVHKLDLLAESIREKTFNEKRIKIIEKTKNFEVDCFKTSIWDETLYKAWS